MHVTRPLACLALIATALPAAAMEDAPAAQPQRGGTFHEPPPRVDPRFLPRGPDQPAGDEAARLTLRLALELPLRPASQGAGAGTQGSRPSTPSLQMELRARPVPAAPAAFVQLVVYRYLHPSRQAPWNPDFGYAFGWDPAGGAQNFFVQYANYSGTRFSPARFNAPEGSWLAGWRFALPSPLRAWLLTGEGDEAQCDARLQWQPRFTQVTGGLGRDKLAAGLGCRYTHPAGWFAHLTLWTYAAGKQQPWDPDYTYGAGWRGASGLGVEYNNFSGNRFPGRDTAAGEGGLRAGSIGLSWLTQW